MTCFVLLGSHARALAAEPCVIQSDAASLKRVTIKPPGEPAFQFDVSEVSIEARPTGKKGMADILVTSPLRFETTHALAELGVRLSKPLDLYDGRLRLAKGVAPSFPGHANPKDTPTGEVAILLPFHGLRIDQAPTLPCSALRAGDANELYNPPMLREAKEAIDYLEGGQRLPLYRARKEVDPLWIEFEGPMEVQSQRGDWLRVRARWQDGSSIQGWIPKRLVSVSHGPPKLFGQVLGSIGFGHCGRSHGPQIVSFKIHAHAPIHSGPKGAVWAHTSGTIEVKALALRRSDGWIQITSLRGFPSAPCSEHNKFWIHARHILWTDTPIDG